ncbi:transmembrane protein [Gossypium australe]|uniref:Transmembrane protein n=1 Tax=Gossypium australe TaxID=47621 RepID=A0A5B6V6K2_9ROSI|nr:transmembrane protein [Gossypium australe]
MDCNMEAHRTYGTIIDGNSFSIKRLAMPHRTRPMTALLVFTGLNAVLVSTITPVYDFVCFLPFWERRDVETDIVTSF